MKIHKSKNIKCMIFIAINAYNMGINNLNIKLIIQ